MKKMKQWQIIKMKNQIIITNKQFQATNTLKKA